ncbi:extracellular solute-binding protein [Streptomyces sp. MZ04]|nr:extracellular solute-binding protein [Streptomyces sp. MZ04]
MSGSRQGVDRRTLLAAAAAGALATACGTAEGKPPGKVAVHGDNATWAKPMAAAGKAMKSVAGIELVPEVIASLESFEQVVRSSLRTSKTPDMLKYWSGYRLQDLARTGGVVDLTEHWDRAVGKGWVEPSLRPAFTYRDRVYALPMNLAYWVFFYNPEVFEKHDLKAPETWDDFLAACARLKKNGITPLHGTADGRWPSFIWFQEVLSRQDPRFYQDLMNGRESYTDPRAERALRTGRCSTATVTASRTAWTAGSTCRTHATPCSSTATACAQATPTSQGAPYAPGPSSTRRPGAGIGPGGNSASTPARATPPSATN